jgi:hypothetical protein
LDCYIYWDFRSCLTLEEEIYASLRKKVYIVLYVPY